METFSEEKLWLFVHITWYSIFKKNVSLKFCNIFVLGAMPENTFSTLGKWKMVFLCNEKENFLRQHCPCFQDACLCRIWEHLNKLCYGCGHNTCHLDRKPRIFVEDSSFLWTHFQYNCRIRNLLFFRILGHI